MSKECPICHANIQETAIICPFCGASQSTEMTLENTWWNSAPTTAPRRGSGYPSSTAKGLTIALAVFCFLSAASMLTLLLLLSTVSRMMEELGLLEEYAELLSLLATSYLPVVLLVVADALFYVVFGILLLVKKSWKIALTITIYSAAGFMVGMFSASPAGIPMVLVFGILSTIWLRKDSMPIV